jgi:hypothetical protein
MSINCSPQISNWYLQKMTSFFVQIVLFLKSKIKLVHFQDYFDSINFFRNHEGTFDLLKV